MQQVSSGAPVSAILPPAPAHPPVRRLDSTVDLPSSDAVPEAVPIPTKKTVERTSIRDLINICSDFKIPMSYIGFGKDTELYIFHT